MPIRIVDNCLIITTSKTKPKKGDWMCTLQVGYTDKRSGEVIIPRKRLLSFHDGKTLSKLNAICFGTEKVLLKFGNVKKD